MTKKKKRINRNRIGPRTLSEHNRKYFRYVGQSRFMVNGYYDSKYSKLFVYYNRYTRFYYYTYARISARYWFFSWHVRFKSYYRLFFICLCCKRRVFTNEPDDNRCDDCASLNKRGCAVRRILAARGYADRLICEHCRTDFEEQGAKALDIHHVNGDGVNERYWHYWYEWHEKIYLDRRRLDDLQVLCKPCHAAIDAERRRL